MDYSESERRDAIRFQRVMSKAPMGAALIEQGGKFLSANQALLELVGAPSEQAFLEMGLRESGSFNSPKIRGLVSSLDEGGPETTFDAEWVSTWGKAISARVFITRLKNEDGAVVYQVFYEDRNAKTRANGEVEHWNAMLNASTNEFFVFDQVTLKFVHINQRGLEQLGYSLDEMLAMTPLDIHPVLTLRDAKALLEPLTKGDEHTISTRLQQRRKDNTAYFVDARIQCTTFKGEPAFVLVSQDITYNLETAAALSQAELFLKQAPDPTLIFDELGEIKFSSARTEHLLGYAPEELDGMKVEDLVADALKSAHDELRANYATDTSGRGFDEAHMVQARHKDGSYVPVEVTLSPIQTKDGLLVAASYRDMTKRIEIENALTAAKEEAERASRAKSRFLASASHDLRQPVQSITQYLWALRKVVTTSQQKTLTDNIEASVDGISDLLNTLLDISKLDSGVITPEISEFDIGMLCAPIVANFAPAAEAKGLVFECRGASHTVKSDPALLLRVLENLVANAIRYTETGLVQLSCEPVNNILKISITDTGVGIAADETERIFDEFYQLENDERNRAKGLGLGLSIVTRLSKLMGHHIAVASKPGEGSVFTVSVDLADKVDAPASIAKTVTDVRKGDSQMVYKVLLVDDDPGVLDSTKTVLEMLDCTVYTASDPDEAIALLEGGLMPEILVTDFRLPGCNGRELLEQVRQTYNTDLPAIIITGDLSPAVLNSQELASVMILNKPTKPSELYDAIAQMVAPD